jgi:hypothetical protein
MQRRTAIRVGGISQSCSNLYHHCPNQEELSTPSSGKNQSPDIEVEAEKGNFHFGSREGKTSSQDG